MQGLADFETDGRMDERTDNFRTDYIIKYIKKLPLFRLMLTFQHVSEFQNRFLHSRNRICYIIVLKIVGLIYL